ncbi:MAG: ADOP family duplicated permease, partial [Terriglobia bacterium]
MKLLSSMRTFLTFLFRRSHVEREMEEELRSHVRSRTDDLERQGLPRGDAERQACIEFGGYQRYKEECREALGTRLLGELIADVRYGLRQLRRNPGFTAVAVLTLALGIGANTAIFSLLDAVMLRSLPVRDPSQLVVFQWNLRQKPSGGYSSFGDCLTSIQKTSAMGCSFSMPFFESVRKNAKQFSGLTAFAGPAALDLSGNGAPRIAVGELVSGNYFSTLGVGAALGRTLGPADDSPGAPAAMVLSYAYWQEAFGGEGTAIGRTVNLNNVPFTVVGVASPNFEQLAPGKSQDLWIPISEAPQILADSWGRHLEDASNWWVVMVGRLKPGVSRTQGQAEVSLLFRDEMLHGPKPLSKVQDSPSIKLIPAEQGLTGMRRLISSQLYVLMFGVGLILLIACANVAGLLVARSTARTKEMAVRLAMGAARARIIRQLLTESVMLSIVGGALGVAFAYWGVRAISGLMWGSSEYGPHFSISPDWRILIFAIVVSLVTGILFGLAPALGSSRIDLTPALKESAFAAGGSHRRRRFRLGNALVVAQVALSVLVLAGAGLLVRTLRNLRNINPGFDTQNVLLFGIDPTLAGYKDTRTQNLYRTMQTRLAALPGVISASYSSDALLSGDLWTSDVYIGRRGDKKSHEVDMLATGPGFLRTLRVPLLEGRTFSGEDFDRAAEAHAASVAAVAKKPKNPTMPFRAPASIPVIVNAAFVHAYFPRENPLGRLISQDADGEKTPGKPSRPDWEIVGVVGNVKDTSLRRTIHPTVYVPFSGGGANFELRTAEN